MIVRIVDLLKPILVGTLLVAVLSASLGVASARDLTEAERSALEARIESFNTAMETLDFQGVLSIVPPKILDHIAEQAGVAPDVVREEMEKVMTEAMEAVTIERFSMDLSAAEERTLADGTPYLLVPTSTTIRSEALGGGLRFDNNTLAFMDEGTWYLLRLDDASQIAILRAVYPAFAGETFPRGTMTRLDGAADEAQREAAPTDGGSAAEDAPSSAAQ